MREGFFVLLQTQLQLSGGQLGKHKTERKSQKNLEIFGWRVGLESALSALYDCQIIKH